MKKTIRIAIFIALMGLGLGCSPQKLTNSQAVEIFDKAGGVEKVNAEATVLFGSLGTNAVYILRDYGVSHLQDYPELTRSHPEITNFPAIFALGDVVLLQRAEASSVPEIYVRFGVHSQAKVIHILPPNLDISRLHDASTYTNDLWYIRIAPNIFVQR